MKPESIFLLSHVTGPRIRYVVEELFERRLGLGILWVSSLSDIPTGQFFISYGMENGRICIPDSGWLKEGTRQGFSIQPDMVQSFKSEGRHIWNMDILGFAFCLLARLEEYDPAESDKHNRFQLSQSVLAKNNLYESPWIDIWVFTIEKQLLEYGIRCQSLQFEESFSFDIDNPTAFRHKGLIRNTGGLLTDLVTGNVSQLKSRIGSILGIRKDPYDTFDEILEWLDEQKKQATFFVWVGDYGPQDKGLNWKNPHIRNLVRRLAKNHQIGLHPSYRAFDEPNRLQKEKERLESIAGISITHSRFHFLRFKIPASYNQLIESGFEWDHSLGYSNAFGFRAATSRSFRFYDLNKEASTSLKIQPFSLMDSTAFYELKLDQHEWIAKTIHFRQMLKVLNGHLNVVMHNDVSFFRYKPDFI